MAISFFDNPHPLDMDERYHQLNAANIAHVAYWHRFLQMIEYVKGDIVECGVRRGRSLMILCGLNSLFSGPEGVPRRVYAYDSFQGFPEPVKQDDSARQPQKGEWAFSPIGRYRYDENFIRQVFDEAFMNPMEIALTLRSGFFNESLPEHPSQPIALLHLDGDLYESHKVPLEILFHLISPGGILVLDDVWDPAHQAHPPFPGAGLAVNEFLGARNAVLQTSILGNRFYVVDSNR